MFPFYLSGIEGMQLAQIVHSVVAVLFVAAMLAHIYIGTIGMEGAFEAMGSGHGRRQLGQGAPQPVARRARMRAPAQTMRGPALVTAARVGLTSSLRRSTHTC